MVSMLKYKCTTEDCSRVVYEDDMNADWYWIYDADGEPDDEVWSNWICPKCQVWHPSLEDGYVEIYEQTEA
jgi:hypothetical protein